MKSPFQSLSHFCKVFSHPKRIEIMHLLLQKECTVNEIVTMTGLSQATVSQHLSRLLSDGYVCVEQKTQQHVYSPCPTQIKQVQHLLSLGQKAKNLAFDELYSDPVCGMKVSKKSAAAHVRIAGTAYYFCGLGCKKAFVQHYKKGDYV